MTTSQYTKAVKDWITEAGLRAMILLVRGSHHCGYVEVPTRLNEPHYDDDILMDIGVHGGLTYSGILDSMDGKYAVGYDCAHFGDLQKCPQNLVGTTMERSFMYNEGTWRDEDYCANECESLAEQLIQLK